MDQALDARLKLNKRTVIGDVRYATSMHRFQRVLGSDQIPWIFLQLLHPQRNAVGFLVDLDDLHLDGFANRQDLGRVVDAAPGHVGDVQQAVHTAQIHEGPVFGDVLDHTVDRLAFGQVADHLGTLFGAAFFQDSAARDHDVAPAAVHFQDLERLLHAHQRAGVAHRAHIDLRAGQEGHGAAQIDGEAAFDPTEDGSFDALFVGVGFFQTVPGFFPAGHFAADHRFTARVFDLAEEDLDLITHFDFRGFTRICEFFKLDAAFHLVAYVDDGLARLNRDDLTFDNRPFLGRVNFEAFLQEGFEFLHGCIRHVAFQSFTSCFWPRGCLHGSFGSNLVEGVFIKQSGPVDTDPARVSDHGCPAASTCAAIHKTQHNGKSALTYQSRLMRGPLDRRGQRHRAASPVCLISSPSSD